MLSSESANGFEEEAKVRLFGVEEKKKVEEGLVAGNRRRRSTKVKLSFHRISGV